MYSSRALRDASAGQQPISVPDNTYRTMENASLFQKFTTADRRIARLPARRLTQFSARHIRLRARARSVQRRKFNFIVVGSGRGVMRRFLLSILTMGIAGLVGFSIGSRPWTVRGADNTPSIAAVSGQVGGQDIFGPYEVAKDWPA